MATRTDPTTQHTFLVVDGRWQARGTGVVGPMGMGGTITGNTVVTNRGGGLVTAESLMVVHASLSFEVHQQYEVRRTSNPDRYQFLTRSDRIGELQGELWLLPSYIMLHYASAKGRFRGSEVLIRRTPEHYTAIGQFIADSKAQTVWEVELHRVAEDDPLSLA